jgi:tetratricopeptide (TPR) repeat protein
MGDYAKVESLLQRALAIRDKALGPEHSDTATSLNNLAGLYRLTGDYAKAEPLLRRALAICEKTLGPEHPLTAGSVSNLAILDMGSWQSERRTGIGRACREGSRISARQYPLLHLRTATAGISRDHHSFHACCHAGQCT